MRSFNLFHVAVLAACLCLSATPTDAEVFDLTANIDGFQTVPPTNSAGFGNGVVTLDADTNLLSWDISWTDLTGPVTVAHFHGPATPGDNAGVQVNFGGISGTTSPSIGSTAITAQQSADLLDGLYYINIHTSQFPAGEIRGQVLLVPEPAGIALVALGVASMGFVARRGRARR